MEREDDGGPLLSALRRTWKLPRNDIPDRQDSRTCRPSYPAMQQVIHRLQPEVLNSSINEIYKITLLMRPGKAGTACIAFVSLIGMRALRPQPPIFGRTFLAKNCVLSMCGLVSHALA